MTEHHALDATLTRLLAAWERNLPLSDPDPAPVDAPGFGAFDPGYTAALDAAADAAPEDAPAPEAGSGLFGIFAAIIADMRSWGADGPFVLTGDVVVYPDNGPATMRSFVGGTWHDEPAPEYGSTMVTVLYGDRGHGADYGIDRATGEVSCWAN